MMLNLAAGPSLLVAITSMVVLSFGEIFNMPFANTFAINRASAENRGAYMGLFTMTYSLAHIVGPPLGTQTVYYFGFETLWNLMGAMSLVSVIGFLYLKKRMTKKALSTQSVEIEVAH